MAGGISSLIKPIKKRSATPRTGGDNNPKNDKEKKNKVQQVKDKGQGEEKRKEDRGGHEKYDD